MYDNALKLNPYYPETYCNIGNKFRFIFQELH